MLLAAEKRALCSCCINANATRAQSPRCFDVPRVRVPHTGATRVRASRNQPASGAGDVEDGTVTLEWRMSTAAAMLKFMAPALIVPLSDPIMSLIDAVCLGRFAGTLQLAALGPTTVIFSFASYVFNALGIGTITAVSQKVADDDQKAASQLATAALCIALVCGVASSAILWSLAPQLIAATGAVPELAGLAESYLRIRAAAQPALLVSVVTQSCLLAQKDSRSPALAIALQIIVNASLDVGLIAFAGSGIQGAAWATVAAQYLGMLLLLYRLSGSPAVRYTRLWQRSLWPSVRHLSRILAPLLVIYISRNLAYLMLQRAAATLEPVKLAAHQAVWSLFTIGSFSMATLEQAGIAFIPSNTNKAMQFATMRLIRQMGIVIGITVGSLCGSLGTVGASFFTVDAAVHAQMARISPYCAGVMIACGADISANAVLIALGMSAYLARSFTLTLAVVALFSWVAFYLQNWGLIGVWSGLIFFFAMRCLQSSLGVAIYARQRVLEKFA